jgi:hypothetical protein
VSDSSKIEWTDASHWLDRFAAAFPDQYEALVALTFEHASSLDMDEVAA